MGEKALANALERAGLDYEVDEGAGAFYGPKIDIKIRDALKRSWQCTTIQFDFNLPERFGLCGSQGDFRVAREVLWGDAGALCRRVSALAGARASESPADLG
jgi:hypothetical protein